MPLSATQCLRGRSGAGLSVPWVARWPLQEVAHCTGGLCALPGAGRPRSACGACGGMDSWDQLQSVAGTGRENQCWAKAPAAAAGACRDPLGAQVPAPLRGNLGQPRQRAGTRGAVHLGLHALWWLGSWPSWSRTADCARGWIQTRAGDLEQ